MVGSASTQSSRTSPGSLATTQPTTSVSASASPPPTSLTSPDASGPLNALATTAATEISSPTVSKPASAMANPLSYPFSPIGPPGPLDGLNPKRRGESEMSPPLNGFSRPAAGAAILMRKLPKSTSREALRSMLLFAKDFVDVDFVPSDRPEDANFLSAVARFETLAAAEEAQAMLDGKPNTTNEANMIVELYPGATIPTRRNTIDHPAGRAPISSGRQSSRFNGTFQTMANGGTMTSQSSAGEGLPAPDTNSRLHRIFSPQSPIGTGMGELPRVSGKSVIDQDPDEETGELLKDPVGYAQNGHNASMSMPRRSTNPQIPTSRFANLSLSTNVTSPSATNYSAGARMGPGSNMHPAMGGNPSFHFPNQHNPRHSLPAANPNDLNPPCNTLYVGNLPPDTQEEELKALFSKQRGYKRLCFRNKQNGPMCFVEFDEVAMASKALNELYGYKLSNSVKTGIRLSFSKNPLGVRSNQNNNNNNNANNQNALNSQNAGHMHGYAGPGPMNSHMFSTATGPPPGLSAPPGLAHPMSMRNGALPPPGNPMSGGAAFNANNGLGIRANGLNTFNNPSLGPGVTSGMVSPGIGGYGNVYPDYMMGR
ncbi:hypothetical protein VTN49DRAFT_5039 [Thermomyces lanuginosus]|uniref:uncharacterized protein n=1 Tax=Thermomyces lanuginosus TaxID=5541 RepID=UPI003744A9DE